MMNDNPSSNNDGQPVRISVVIPSLSGDETVLRKLTDTVMNAGFETKELEVLSAVDVRPNGRARDFGTLYASGDYLIFMDEDVSFPEPRDLKTLIDFLEAHPEAGLVGPAQQIPPDTPETVRDRALQMPRSHVEVPDTFRESDMVTHACLALRRETFLEVGMEHPNLISGTDPDLRHRIRQRGLSVGIVPGTRVYHPPIDNWYDLLRKNFRGGRRSRAVKRNYPDYHLPAEPDVTDTEETRSQDTLSAKATNHLRRFFTAARRGRFWWLSAQLGYLIGYGTEILYPTRKVEPIPYPDPPVPDQPGWNEFLDALRQEGTIKKLHPSTEEPELQLPR